jgi:hypothetical protein
MLYTFCLFIPAGSLQELRIKRINFDKVRENDMKEFGD